MIVMESNLELLDLGVNYDILAMGLSGNTNLAISIELDLDEKFIKETLQMFLGFSGFERRTFTLSPIRIYKNCKGNLECVKEKLIEHQIDICDIDEFIKVLIKFFKIKERIGK
jgi:hypothetical protein